jgi:anti-sigma factor RsiW
MANERNKRLMQEALDENLSPEMRAELLAHLDQDARDAEAFDRLKQVDRMLRTAPHERAPRRLAMSIMAKLAETLNPQQLSRISGLALALGLALVAAVLIPLLVAVGWLVLMGMGSAAALSSAVSQLVAILSVGITLLEAVVQQIQAFMTANPGLPALMILLIPASVLWVWRYLPRNRSTDTP